MQFPIGYSTWPQQDKQKVCQYTATVRRRPHLWLPCRT
uniref:Uncharacterized protein n=1 Tax=Anguilla anguilla TaxID=7936 RepID=A0A0E9T309_ANGAN